VLLVQGGGCGSVDMPFGGRCRADEATTEVNEAMLAFLESNS
jgi:hypothetical protein